MNRQEIIDNLRLEISNKDLMIIDLTFKNKDLIKLLERAKEQINDEVLLNDIITMLWSLK